MGSFISKLENLFRENFPGSVIELKRDYPSRKISGTLVWEGFEGLDYIDRYHEVWRVLTPLLTPEEKRKITLISTFTPAEQDDFNQPVETYDDAGWGSKSRETLREKLEILCRENFPGSKLEWESDYPSGKMDGTLIWDGFDLLDMQERRRRMMDILDPLLALEERRRFSIWTYTHPEWKGIKRADRLSAMAG